MTKFEEALHGGFLREYITSDFDEGFYIRFDIAFKDFVGKPCFLSIAYYWKVQDGFDYCDLLLMRLMALDWLIANWEIESFIRLDKPICNIPQFAAMQACLTEAGYP